MNDQLHADAAFEALRSARPPLPEGRIDADSPAAVAMLDAVVHVGSARPSAKRRVVFAAAAFSLAAAITAVVVAVSSVGVRDGKVIVRQQPASADVGAIARASTAALAASGRAEVTFDVESGSFADERGRSRVAFAGADFDIELAFAGAAGRPGFTAHNRTVNGEYYLLDGAPGAKHWYHDIGTTPSGADLFSLDPRTLLSVLQPTAGFVVVGTEQTADGALRHLHATNLDALPGLHLVLGPIEGRDITGLDLWVASDNTVRRLDLASSHSEKQQPACFEQGGVKQCAGPNDKLAKSADGKITIIPGPSGAAPAAPRTITTTSEYSVTFSDIGTPISITAPANPIEVHGQG